MKRGNGVARRSASVGCVLVTLGIDALGFGIVVPVLPMQFGCAPLLGALSDRWGRRPVLLVSLAGTCANYLMLVWAPSLGWLFLGRVIAGATSASASAANAYIADVTPPERRAQRFGLVGAMWGLGFVLGPAFGGVLGAYGPRLPFAAAAALAGCNFIYGAAILPESLPLTSRRPFRWRAANPAGTVHVIGANPAYKRLAFAWCCAWFALGALQSSFVLANQVRFAWSPPQNGFALAAAGLGSAVVQGLLLRRIIRRLGERRAALTGYVLAGLGFSCFAFAGVGFVIYVGVVLHALGAISGPAVQSMVSVRAGPERQGEVQGALASLQGLTAIFSPLVAGSLFGLFTGAAAPLYFPGAPFLFAGLAYLLAFLAVLGLSRPPKGDGAALRSE